MNELAEYTGIVIEEQLLDLLATSEGAEQIYRAHFDSDWIPEREAEVRQVLEWAMGYYRQHGEPAPREVLEFEFGTEFKEPVVPVDYVLERFRERHKRNKLKVALAKMSRLVNADPAETLRYGVNELTRLQAETVTKQTVVTSDDIELVIERYKERVLRRQSGDLVSFGYPEMDEVFGGIEGFIVVVARPKQTKSWQLLKSAIESQYKYVPTSFETLELPKEEMLDRYACMRSGVSYSRFMRGELSYDELEMMKSAKDENENEENAESKIWFHAAPPGERTPRHMLIRARENQTKCIYVDQLSWVESERIYPDQRWREIEHIVRDLKEVSKEIPVYMAAQFNRQAAGLSEMADLSKIGLSDAVGQTADLILGIYANKEMTKAGEFEFGVVEARNYEIHRWDVRKELRECSNFRIIGEKDDW